MNKEPVYMEGDGGDISGEQFFNNLPNVTNPE